MAANPSQAATSHRHRSRPRTTTSETARSGARSLPPAYDVRDRAQCERHRDRRAIAPPIQPARTLDRRAAPSRGKAVPSRPRRRRDRARRATGTYPRAQRWQRPPRDCEVRRYASQPRRSTAPRTQVEAKPRATSRSGTRDAVHAGEAVDEDRALVVEKRREIERKARSVLVASLGRDGMGVVRDRCLVAEERRGIGRRDPQLERADCEYDTGSEQ